jgi:hypothetical protein
VEPVGLLVELGERRAAPIVPRTLSTRAWASSDKPPGSGYQACQGDLLLVMQAVEELIWSIREAAMEDHRIVFEAHAIPLPLQTD